MLLSEVHRFSFYHQRLTNWYLWNCFVLKSVMPCLVNDANLERTFQGYLSVALTSCRERCFKTITNSFSEKLQDTYETKMDSSIGTLLCSSSWGAAKRFQSPLANLLYTSANISSGVPCMFPLTWRPCLLCDCVVCLMFFEGHAVSYWPFSSVWDR